MIHVNVLRNYGRSSVSEGAVVELQAQESSRGLQATEILEIIPPPNLEFGDEEYTGMQLGEDRNAADFLPARVKWFDKQRGFGFVNVFGSADDVFIHMEVLRNCGLSDLQAGEAISVRIASGPRGKLVAEVQPWDFAVADDDFEEPGDDPDI